MACFHDIHASPRKFAWCSYTRAPYRRWGQCWCGGSPSWILSRGHILGRPSVQQADAMDAATTGLLQALSSHCLPIGAAYLYLSGTYLFVLQWAEESKVAATVWGIFKQV